MIIGLALGLLVLYNLFRRLTAGLRGCQTTDSVHYCIPHMYLIQPSLMPASFSKK